MYVLTQIFQVISVHLKKRSHRKFETHTFYSFTCQWFPQLFPKVITWKSYSAMFSAYLQLFLWYFQNKSEISNNEWLSGMVAWGPSRLAIFLPNHSTFVSNWLCQLLCQSHLGPNLELEGVWVGTVQLLSPANTLSSVLFYGKDSWPKNANTKTVYRRLKWRVLSQNKLNSIFDIFKTLRQPSYKTN